VAVVRYPSASNLDELRPLEQVAAVRWARRAADLDGADLVVLPGSKHVAADLGWLRRTGLDRSLERHAAAGRRLLGICGGLQVLGERLDDPHGVDGSGPGLGLLPLITAFARAKLVRTARARFRPLAEPWRALSGRSFRGYEIRHGRTRPVDGVAEALPDGLGYARGAVLGVYPHGLLEDPDVVRALLGRAPARDLQATFDLLADAVEDHLDTARLDALAGLA
jgi:adenosylcobyric acid synthase